MDINRAPERPDPGYPRIAASATSSTGNRGFSRSLVNKSIQAVLLSKQFSHASHVNGQDEYQSPLERPVLGYPHVAAWDSGNRGFSRFLINRRMQLSKLYSHASHVNGEDEDQSPLQDEDQILLQDEVQIPLGPYLVRVWIPITPALKRVGRQVERDYRRVRDSSQLKKDEHIGVVAQLTADAVENITGTDGESMSSNSNSHCCSVSRWKRGPGRSKGWKQSRFADLREWCRYSDLDHSRSRTLSQWTIDVPRLAAESVSPARLRVPGVPSDMLRSWGHKPKAFGLIIRSQQPTDKRTFLVPRRDSNAYRDQFLRNGRRNSKNGMKPSIENDFAGRHTGGYDDVEFLSEDEYAGDNQDKFLSSHRSCHTRPAPFDTTGAKCGRQTAKRLTVPYESHIGAIIGSQFRMSAFIRSEACYDFYAVKDLFHEEYCLAKAYTVRGTKGKERDARLKNLKRSSNNACLMASIDQNGRKWLVFSNSLDLGRDKDTSLNPLAWRGEKEYKLHFPGIESNHIKPYLQQCTFSKSYASCLQASKDSTQNHSTIKAQRARERQRRKRQDRRAIRAAVRDAVEVRDSLLEGKRDSIESFGERDEVGKKIAPQEAEGQRASTEPAVSRANLEMVSSAKVEQSDTQDSRPPPPPEQANLEYRLPSHNHENYQILIPCMHPQDPCPACDALLRLEDAGHPNGSRFHVIDVSALMRFKRWARSYGSPIHHFVTHCDGKGRTPLWYR